MGNDKVLGYVLKYKMYEEIIRPVIVRELRTVFSMPDEKSYEEKIEEELYFTNSRKIFNHLDIKNRTEWEDRYYN